MTTKTANIFTGHIDFCPQCGAILPLPGVEDTISCKVCSFKVHVSEFDNVQIVSQVTFNKRGVWASRGVDKTASGPLVDRKCPKCGHEGMTYATLQTRSADEGQTVFYGCPQCNHQENENS